MSRPLRVLADDRLIERRPRGPVTDVDWEATTGANVILAEPYDPIVFARSRSIKGMSVVSTAQAAADLLTGPGRMPQEGAALLGWMDASEHRYREDR